MKSLFQAAVLTSAATLALAPIAHAGSFGVDDGISFDSQTTLEFTFEEARGSYQSSLGIYSVIDGEATLEEVLFAETMGSDVGSSNYLSTCGVDGVSAIENCTAQFTFEAGVDYALGLILNNTNVHSGVKYSTTDLNDGSQQAIFDENEFSFAAGDTVAFGNPGDYTDDVFAALNDVVWIGFDDGGNQNDVDFQDFVVSTSIVDSESVPEPASAIALLAVGAASLKLGRRNNA
ncbi:MAG: PEP-CTERM sorting domain-containing protein [Geitlerinemataceae cyanobacterium]